MMGRRLTQSTAPPNPIEFNRIDPSATHHRTGGRPTTPNTNTAGDVRTVWASEVVEGGFFSVWMSKPAFSDDGGEPCSGAKAQAGLNFRCDSVRTAGSE